MSESLVADLREEMSAEIARAGYYPQFVSEVVAASLAGEPVRAYLVHPETTFDREEVRRHLTVAALTPGRLLVTHVDDLPPDEAHPPSAAATTEAASLSRIQSVLVTRTVSHPEQYPQGAGDSELTLVVSWGGVRRMEIEPATCPDPNCEAEHGFAGSSTPEDFMVRVSARAEGMAALTAAQRFADAISLATK